MIWTLIALVAGLTWGFWFGKNVGEANGYKKGISEAPIELRERALLGARCPVCGGATAERDQAAAPIRTVAGPVL